MEKIMWLVLILMIIIGAVIILWMTFFQEFPYVLGEMFIACIPISFCIGLLISRRKN